MGLLKGVGYVFLALILLGVLVGIATFIYLIKMITAGILLVAFLAYCIRLWFQSRKKAQKSQ